MGTYFVTGASSGIGKLVAEQFRDRGDSLVLMARHKKRAQQLQADFPGSSIVTYDLEGAEYPTFMEQLPDALDGVVHAAGVVTVDTLEDTEDGWLARTINTNLLAPMHVTKALLVPVRRGRGTHVFVNSGSGLVAKASWSAYNASKFGLRGFADALRQEEREHGVRVTSVYPGRVATPMQEDVHRQEGKEYDPTEWVRPATVAEQIVSVLDLAEDATVTDLTISSR